MSVAEEWRASVEAHEAFVAAVIACLSRWDRSGISEARAEAFADRLYLARGAARRTNHCPTEAMLRLAKWWTQLDDVALMKAWYGRGLLDPTTIDAETDLRRALIDAAPFIDPAIDDESVRWVRAALAWVPVKPQDRPTRGELPAWAVAAGVVPIDESRRSGPIENADLDAALDAAIELWVARGHGELRWSKAGVATSRNFRGFIADLAAAARLTISDRRVDAALGRWRAARA